MEVLRRTFGQFLGLYRSMTPSQRGTLIAVPAMMLVAFFLLMFNSRSSSYVPLSWGKVFSREELMLAEQSLIDAGLDDFHSKGQRLMVPAADAERYNAVLLESGSLPTDWGSELEKQLESNGLFGSERQTRERKDIALAKLLRRVIRAVPVIEDANVIWARSQGPRRWPHRKQTVTATVNVRPKRHQELSSQIVHSLRVAVAGMVSDLSPADVTVFDQSTGISHTADQEDDPFNGKLLKRIRDFERLHQEKIIAHLSSYIPGVVVSVHVELENLQRSTESNRTFKQEFVVESLVHTQDRTFNQTPTQSEPGVLPNLPRNLQTSGGVQKTQKSTDSKEELRNVPAELMISQKEYIAAMPKAVQVSVAIPKSYYQAIALQRQQETATSADAAADTEGDQPVELSAAEITQIEADVKATVATLIPAASPEEAIFVSSYTPIPPKVEQIEQAFADQASDAMSQWGGAIGLAIFALWALRMLSKNMPKLPTDDDETPALTLQPAPDEDDEDEEPVTREATQRDELQTVVRDNPEMAASVLNKWIAPAK